MSPRGGGGRLASVASALAAVLCFAGPGAAQERPPLRLVPPGEDVTRRVDVGWHRGYAAVPANTLESLGWSVREAGDSVVATSAGAVVSLEAGTPFFRWDGEILQLVDEPYRFSDAVWVPLQLLTDFLPARLGDAYAFEAESATLRVLDRAMWSPAERAAPASVSAASPPPSAREPAGVAAPPSKAKGAAATPGRRDEAAVRVVVIDPGHGGRDPGALGPRGTREKDVALALALALARELRSRPGLEVHLTREDDHLVPLWRRGQWATEVKGTRPGVFLSIHANAMPSRSNARGFETYFLSPARTEHERRVAALENAAARLEGNEGASSTDAPGLEFILKELRNFDHSHWSALLAQLIQDRLAPIHPGPDRGVKQAPFAVITNALMPAVLVEVGFITNREEARVLTRPSFQADVARALGDAVVDFFERYPPGADAGGRGGGR